MVTTSNSVRSALSGLVGAGLRVADGALAGTIDRLREDGVHLRSDPIVGVGGKQVVIDDPSGNPIELFEPTRTEARLDRH